MLKNVHYPYGIPFYKDVDMINVSFQNNDQTEFNIYFLKDGGKGNLAGIIFPNEKKNYQFPKNSKVIIETNKKGHVCYINLQADWTYIYP